MNKRDINIYVIGYYTNQFIVILNLSHCPNDCLSLIKHKILFMGMAALNDILNIICDPFVIHLCACAYVRLHCLPSKKRCA